MEERVRRCLILECEFYVQNTSNPQIGNCLDDCQEVIFGDKCKRGYYLGPPQFSNQNRLKHPFSEWTREPLNWP